MVYSYDKYLSAVKEGPQSYFDKGYYVVLLLNFKYFLDHFNDKYVIDKELQHTDDIILWLGRFAIRFVLDKIS
jgi:hypothetical protein